MAAGIGLVSTRKDCCLVFSTKGSAPYRGELSVETARCGRDPDRASVTVHHRGRCSFSPKNQAMVLVGTAPIFSSRAPSSFKRLFRVALHIYRSRWQNEPLWPSGRQENFGIRCCTNAEEAMPGCTDGERIEAWRPVTIYPHTTTPLRPAWRRTMTARFHLGDCLGMRTDSRIAPSRDDICSIRAGWLPKRADW